MKYIRCIIFIDIISSLTLINIISNNYNNKPFYHLYIYILSKITELI